MCVIGAQIITNNLCISNAFLLENPKIKYFYYNKNIKSEEPDNSPLKTSLNSPGGAWMTKFAAMRTCKQRHFNLMDV